MVLLAPLLAGCLQYEWRYDCEAAERQARVQNKDLFIYYKWWLDSDSNRMLGNEVLSDPQVVRLFQDTVNLLVERDSGPSYVQYMAKYGVDSVPASVIVRPDGRYEALTGFTPRERFIEFVERTRSAPSTSGASVPGKRP
jgi:hypothetical protein